MKKMLKFILFFFITFSIFIPSINASEENFISKIDNNINYDKEINGNGFFFGNNISINKKINGVSFILGNNVNINGEIDYIISYGNMININGKINNDAIIVGNNINISKDSIINRDIIVKGKNVTISGKINRNVKIYSKELNINNSVIDGNVSINTEKMYIDENSIINNKISYNETAEVDIVNKDNIREIEKLNISNPTIIDILLERLLSFTRLLVILFTLIIIVPSLFRKINKIQKEKNIRKIFILFVKGTLILILIPLISIILVISNLGISLGIITAIIYGILIYISQIFTGYYIGKIIEEKIIKKEFNTFLIGVLGLLIIYLLKLIPYIGIVISLISWILGLGIIIDLFKKKSSSK